MGKKKSSAPASKSAPVAPSSPSKNVKPSSTRSASAKANGHQLTVAENKKNGGKSNAKAEVSVGDDEWDDEDGEAYDTQQGEEDEAMESGEDEVEVEEDEVDQLNQAENEEGEDEDGEDEDGEDEDFADDGEDDENEDDEGEDDDDDDDGGLPAMSAADLVGFLAMMTKMKQQDGPIVTGVLLTVDGRMSEHTLDMTPRADAIGKLLGGKCTFVGQYPPPLSATIMMRKDQETKGLKVNKHTLAPPYDQDAGQLRGDLLLIRMDEDNNPTDITQKEYEAYRANPTPITEADEDADDESNDNKKKPNKKGGKKKGFSTEEAVAIAKQKRKSTGLPEELYPEKSDEEEEESQSTQKKSVSKKSNVDAPVKQAKKKQKISK